MKCSDKEKIKAWVVADPVVTPEMSESRDASEPAEVSENFERYDEVDERLAACLLPNFKTEFQLIIRRKFYYNTYECKRILQSDWFQKRKENW